MDTPLVSAIVPAYNAAEFIGRALDSVRAQTHANVEVIVVDDGSADNTAEVVGEGYPEVTLIEQPQNAGPATARNVAVQFCRGQYLAFLDADDEWMPEKVQRQVRVLFERPDIAILGTNAWRAGGSVRYLATGSRRPRLTRVTINDICSHRGPLSASIMLARDTFLACGGYDPSYRNFEDFEFLCRAVAAGHTYYFLNEPLYLQHKRPGSVSRARQSQAIVDDMLTLLATLDPDGPDALHPSLLARAEHARLVAEQITIAYASALAEGASKQQVLERIPRLAARPSLPLGFRGLAWLESRSWPLFSLGVRLYRPWWTLRRLVDEWGIIGGIHQARLKLRSAGGKSSAPG